MRASRFIGGRQNRRGDALLREKAKVDWSQIGAFISGAGVLVGLVTLGLVSYQVYLMIRQTRIMEQQAELLDRRGVPRLLAETQDRGSPGGIRTVDVHFSVQNCGTAALRDFNCRIQVPANIAERIGDLPYSKELVPINGAVWMGMLRRVREMTIFPGKTEVVMSIQLLNPAVGPVFPVRWEVITERGVFPEEDAQPIQISFS
jgi:hypothetical protein